MVFFFFFLLIIVIAVSAFEGRGHSIVALDGSIKTAS